MQTLFTLAQLADPQVAESERILRTCVHCGFCTATCPTYVLDGDELDSPRGRIYLIKDMLEYDRPASRRGGQAHRPLPVVSRLHDHLPVRGALHAPGRSCPRPHRGHLRPAAAWTAGCAPRSPGSCPTMAGCAGRLRAGAPGAAVRRPARGLRSRAARRHAAARPGAAAAAAAAYGSRRRRGGAAQGARKGRVALLAGCVSPVIKPSINASRDPGPHPPRHRGGAGARARAAAVPSSTISAASRTRSRPPAPISTPGRGKSPPAASTPSWSRRRAAAPRSRTTASCCAVIRPMPARRRGSRRSPGTSASIWPASTCPQSGESEGLINRLSFGLFAAAWAENRAPTKRIALQDRIRGQRCTGRTSLLRLGRDLQHFAAGHREEVARSQSGEYREACARRDRCRQYRLYHPDRGGHGDPGGPYGRADRLGDRGSQA